MKIENIVFDAKELHSDSHLSFVFNSRIIWSQTLSIYNTESLQ